MKPGIRIIDAGYGNTFSVRQALEQAGARIVDKDEDASVLPGVGSFDQGAANMDEARAALENGRPFLGICLGMQLLFESSEEGGRKGIGVLPGRVRKLKAEKLPHMGWNTVEFKDSRLAEGLPSSWVYFVHSYACPDTAFATGWAAYGERGRFCAALEKGNVFGVQFHPEKSGKSGLKVLENFVEVVRQWK